MPAWTVGWQPWRLMSIVYVQRSLSSGTTTHISLCRPSSSLLQSEHLQAERYSGLYGYSIHCLVLKAHVGRSVWMKLFYKGVQCSELPGWFLLLPEKDPLEFKSQKPLIVWPCLNCVVNSNVLKSNFFSLLPEHQTYILFFSCWIASTVNTFRSYRIHPFFIFGNYVIPSPQEIIACTSNICLTQLK